MRPVVSIILPTFDRLHFLQEAVASVRAQTESSWELIVIDDGSTDDTVAWLESLHDPRIVVVRREHTGRIGELRNVGLEMARADWIAFLDSDDRWRPDKLERQLAFHAANPRFRWSYSDRTMIDADGGSLPPDRFTPWRAHSGNILLAVLRLEANIALPSVMVQRALLREVGGFDPSWLVAGDFELWLRLAEVAECGVIDAPLIDVRKHRATTYQWPEVSLAFADMFRAFARRTTDPALRTMARTSEAYHAVNAADRLGLLHRWSDAAAALRVALRVHPSAPFVYRAMARLIGRRLRRIIATR